ncbi:hypothetical protein FRB96_005507 [Tulasnella sp. 330]|nr:hypothetical protein FRB96_005507 [Tulasnella sp. 330]KAG8877393.1 hypothetical protein FRB97_003434 [Tulasnella sp. 331]KAG8884162.1 hypothetical protein FRB98_002578 [Tulasnella sp. 332]
MRGSIFSLRSGSNSVANSPTQLPTNAAPATPGSRPDSGVYVVSDVEPLSLPPSAATDIINNSNTLSRSRPLSRLGLTAFRKPSPAPISRSSTVATPMGNGVTPAPTPPASPAPAPVGTAVGAGSMSYLDGLSLKLGEAVSRALLVPVVPHGSMSMGIAKAAHVASGTTGGAKAGDMMDCILKGKRPLPAGRGRALGVMIANELHAASQDSFLYRAVLRLLQRPLSVLMTNLTTQVTNLILAPEFVYVSTTAPLNATQVHALALAHFASELLETFDALGLGRSSQRNQLAGDGLRPDKEALESAVSKVVGPFLTAIKREVGAAVGEFQRDPSTIGNVEKALNRVAPLLGRVTFAGDAGGQSQFVQSMLATLEIGTIWQCLTSLADRSLPRALTALSPTSLLQDDRSSEVRRSVSAGELRSQASQKRHSSGSPVQSSGDQSPDYATQLPSYVTPPDTPQVAPVRSFGEANSPETGTREKRLSIGSNGGRIGSSQSSTRLLTPPASKKLSIVKLPSLRPLTSSVISRAPSPPQTTLTSSSEGKSSLMSSTSSTSSQQPKSAIDVTTLPADSLLTALSGIAKDTSIVVTAIKRLPLPLEGGLARDAVDEATKEMTGFLSFMEYLIGENTSVTPLEARLKSVEHLMQKTRQTPMLLAMPILLRVVLSSTPSIADIAPDTVSGWIGLSEAEYKGTCLSGFRKADECAPIVGKAFLKNRMVTGLGWMREWAERSTREEEEDSSDDEDDENGF